MCALVSSALFPAAHGVGGRVGPVYLAKMEVVDQSVIRTLPSSNGHGHYSSYVRCFLIEPTSIIGNGHGWHLGKLRLYY